MPSSVIYGMLYDPRGQTLDVVFRGGRGTYRYSEVPGEVWRAFVRAPSKGTFLNTTFKDGGYGYRKVEGGMLPRVAAEAAGGVSRRGSRDVPDANVWGFYE